MAYKGRFRMASELVAGILLIALFVAMVVGVVSYNRRRDTCPKCGDASKPDIPREIGRDPDHGSTELVICKACGHKWRRMPKIGTEGG